MLYPTLSTKHRNKKGRDILIQKKYFMINAKIKVKNKKKNFVDNPPFYNLHHSLQSKVPRPSYTTSLHPYHDSIVIQPP